MGDTQNQTTVTDEQIDTQITELNEKTDRTDEDSSKLEGLKSEKQTRYQKRINELSWRSKNAQEELDKERERTKELETQLSEKDNAAPVRTTDDTIMINNVRHYTDSALLSKVKSGEMSDDEAFKLQQSRLKEEAADMAYQRITKENKEKDFKTTQDSDRAKVLSEHPNFNTRHPDHNPNDPLYKEVNRIYMNGYYAKPDGLSLAITDAKRMLGITSGRVDNTNNLNLHSPGAPESNDKKGEITITDADKEFATRMYRDKLNPRTGRNYTETESVEKYRQALEKRRA